MKLTLLALNCSACVVATGQQKIPTSDEEMLKLTHRNITSDTLFEYVKHISDSLIYQGYLAGSQRMVRAES